MPYTTTRFFSICIWFSSMSLEFNALYYKRILNEGNSFVERQVDIDVNIDDDICDDDKVDKILEFDMCMRNFRAQNRKLPLNTNQIAPYPSSCISIYPILSHCTFILLHMFLSCFRRIN